VVIKMSLQFTAKTEEFWQSQNSSALAT